MADSNQFTIEVAEFGSTYLAQEAAALSPGQWADIGSGMPGLSSLGPDPIATGGSIFEYSNKAGYDPINKIVHFVGGGHHSSAPNNLQGTLVHVQYDVASNTWTQSGPDVPYYGSFQHAWDHNVVDPTRGEHYFIKPNYSNPGVTLWRYSGSSWSSITNSSISGIESTYGGVYDIYRDGVFVWSDQGLQFWDRGSNSWSQRGSPSGLSGPYHCVAHQDRASGDLWLIDSFNNSGGNWRYTTSNTFESLPDSPVGMYCAGGSGQLTDYDFRTGEFLGVDPWSGTIRALSLAAGSWRTASPTNGTLPLNNVDSDVEGFICGIDDFGGVVMFVMARGGGGIGPPDCYLYKHV